MIAFARNLVNRAWIAACAREQFRFSAATERVEETQRNYLLNLLHRNAQTLFGQKHNFVRIDSIAEYQQRVPLHPYETLTPYIEAIARGELKVLTSDPVRHFQPTSGSTSGTKLIPWTTTVAKEFRRGINPWLASLYQHQPKLLEGTSYWSVSPPATPLRTIGQLRVGFDSDSEYLGFLGRKLFSFVSAVPPDVTLSLNITEFRTQTLLSLLGDEDLCLISVWSPTFLTALLEDFSQRQDEILDSLARQESSKSKRRADFIHSMARNGHGLFQYEKVWPNLKAISCWTDGSSAIYADNVRKLFPGVLIQGKGLIATEAFVSFPFQEHADPVLAVTSHFFEFQDPDTGEISLAHQLASAKEYLVIVTTGGGLYRYPLGDRIRVTGFIHNAPCFRFVGRDGHVSDLFGEKLSARFVEKVILQAVAQQNIDASFLLLAPTTNARGETCYTLFIEAGMIPDPSALSQLMEEGLTENFHYNKCRDLGQLSALRLFRIQNGGMSPVAVFNQVLQLRGIRPGDIKMSLMDRHLGWEQQFHGSFY